MKNHHWRATPVLTLIALALLALLIALGMWQLHRAQEKRELLAQQANAHNKPVIDNQSLIEHAITLPYRRASLKGQYDVQHQFLLDNRLHQGHPGYNVYTPYKLSGTPYAVLIDRGWIPLPAGSRTSLPALPLTDNIPSIKGLIYIPNSGYNIGPALEPHNQWPHRMQYVDLPLLAQTLGYRLLPVVIRLDADQPQGYLRQWQSVTLLGPQRHIGYAVQWFALALTLVVIYFTLAIKRDKKQNNEQTHT